MSGSGNSVHAITDPAAKTAMTWTSKGMFCEQRDTDVFMLTGRSKFNGLNLNHYSCVQFFPSLKEAKYPMHSMQVIAGHHNMIWPSYTRLTFNINSSTIKYYG